MISVVILTKNSSSYLGRCLRAVARFAEVVVVDNGSTDNSLAIAAQYPNVKVFQRDFCGFGALKNIAAQLATHDWVFFVDSDEIVAANLVTTLLSLTLDEASVYQFYRKNYYDNLLIEGCSWGNDYVGRLYNRKVTAFNNNQVHESIQLNGLRLELVTPGCIYHFPYQNSAQLMAKLEHYAVLYAKNNYGKKSVSAWSIPLRGVVAFLKSYILKKGFLYGSAGLTISAYNAMGVWVKYLKLYELGQKCNLALAIWVNDEQSMELLVSQLNQQCWLAAEVLFLIDTEQLGTNFAQRVTQLSQELIAPCRSVALEREQLDWVAGKLLDRPGSSGRTGSPGRTGSSGRDFLVEHLSANPQLDGVMVFMPEFSFAKPRATLRSRNDFRQQRPVKYAEFVYPRRDSGVVGAV